MSSGHDFQSSTTRWHHEHVPGLRFSGDQPGPYGVGLSGLAM